MGDVRELPVPDGLDGMRLDAGLARLFGLSRTAAADARRGRATSRSTGGPRPSPTRSPRAPGWRSTCPRPSGRAPIVAAPEVVAGLTVLYGDDDIVVVDKPVGVAAHPSPGWTGPTVIGGLAAMGHRVATAAPPSGRASCTGSTSAPPG